MDQPTFGDLEYTHKKHRTRREKFLERLEGLVPWQRLEARIEPHYPKAGRGRRPYALSVMLRVHLVQLCYNLSDPGMEDLLYEAESVRRFVGVRLSEPLPDERSCISATCWRGITSGRSCLRRSTGIWRHRGCGYRRERSWTRPS